MIFQFLQYYVTTSDCYFQQIIIRKLNITRNMRSNLINKKHILIILSIKNTFIHDEAWMFINSSTSTYIPSDNNNIALLMRVIWIFLYFQSFLSYNMCVLKLINLCLKLNILQIFSYDKDYIYCHLWITNVDNRSLKW